MGKAATINVGGPWDYEKAEAITNTVQHLVGEYARARYKFNPMRGPHEGYAVILEELDEMWDAIKANDIPHARKECLQVAAMCLAFLLEVKE